MGGYPSNKNLASHPGQVNGFLWRDLLFITRSIESEWKRRPSLCHPDRSEAKWRDLQFCGPLLEMFFDRTGVQGPSCGLCQDPRSET